LVLHKAPDKGHWWVRNTVALCDHEYTAARGRQLMSREI